MRFKTAKRFNNLFDEISHADYDVLDEASDEDSQKVDSCSEDSPDLELAVRASEISRANSVVD